MDDGIVASDLLTAARKFISSLDDPSNVPYFVSTDHSPSEQLYEDNRSHTSALIISQFPHEIEKMIGRLIVFLPDGKLKQWKDAKKEYKSCFHHKFFHALAEQNVLVVVASSKEGKITGNETEFASQLGVSGCYKMVEASGKIKVEFGPFLEDGEKQSRTLLVSEKHAPMAIFIVSYLVRIHAFLQKELTEISENDRPLWMQVFSDKPPNDFILPDNKYGPYANLMLLLLGSGTASGKFTWGGFTCDEDQQVDLLADNVAGLFNEMLLNQERYKYAGQAIIPPVKGVFFWEKLE